MAIMAGFPEEARPPPASSVVVDDDFCGGWE